MRVLSTAVTSLMAVGAVAVGLVSGAAAETTPRVENLGGAVRAAGNSEVLLYGTDNAETIAKLRVGGCVSEVDPINQSVTVTLDALQEGDQASGNCLVTPMPPVPDTRTDARADEDPGPQTVPDVKVDDLDDFGLKVCRSDTTDSRAGWFRGFACYMGSATACGSREDACSAPVKLDLPTVT